MSTLLAVSFASALHGSTVMDLVGTNRPPPPSHTASSAIVADATWIAEMWQDCQGIQDRLSKRSGFNLAWPHVHLQLCMAANRCHGFLQWRGPGQHMLTSGRTCTGSPLRKPPYKMGIEIKTADVL